MWRWVTGCFQAEDGIRDTSVTGVQTCALPISLGKMVTKSSSPEGAVPCSRRAGDSDAPSGLLGTPVRFFPQGFTLGYQMPGFQPCCRRRLAQIGRASCRERVYVAVGDGLFSSRRRHTRYIGDWSSDVCSSDLPG